MPHHGPAAGAPPCRHPHTRPLASVLLALGALAACGDPPAAPRARDGLPASGAFPNWIEAALQNPLPATAGPPILVGAGDIARCYEPTVPRTVTPPALTAAESTARLLDQIPGTVIAVGDNAYEAGTLEDFLLCYEPTWGRHRARTRPAVGNHEYISGTSGYLAYFGPVVTGAPGYYYAYDLGGWRVIVLNSMSQWMLCREAPDESDPEGSPDSPAEGRRCPGDVVQRAWLERELATHPRLCTVAYFHHPQFSSGKHGSQYAMTRLWDVLYRRGVDVVISGHDHLYERFAPQDPDGVARPDGVREFVVGTGGAELYGLSARAPNSEVLINDTHGVLALSLGDGEYAWAFVATAGEAVRDSGSASCH